MRISSIINIRRCHFGKFIYQPNNEQMKEWGVFYSNDTTTKMLHKTKSPQPLIKNNADVETLNPFNDYLSPNAFIN